MQVFISWSKSASRQLATVLGEWLPDVIQEIKPWMSHENIDKGQRWAAEVGTQLAEVGQGILCVTAENQREPWLNFEAGALAKSLEESRVRPVLLDLKPADLTGPLAQFQATSATDKDDMFRLVVSLNGSCSRALPPDRLRKYFDRMWNDYLERIQAIPPSAVPRTAPPKRSSDELIEEILVRVRDLQRSSGKDHSTGPGRRSARDFAIVLRDGSVIRSGDLVLHKDHGPGKAEVLLTARGNRPRLGVDFENGGAKAVSVAELYSDPFYEASLAREAAEGEVVEAED